MKIKQQVYDSITQIWKILRHSESPPESKKKIKDEPANFETAIEATGFGKFNILLLLIAFPSGMSTLFASTTMAYIIPIAECDLNLSLENKGMLNAIVYLGMITSGFFWGYLSDTLGRKKLLVAGFLSDGFCVVLSGFSQRYIMLLISKFFQGFVINGAFSANISYLNEFHCAKYRSYLPSVNGIIQSIACIILPLLGWLILTRPVYINIFNGFLVVRSWNLFLLICSLPSLTAGFTYMLLPESPKFQMTSGNNHLAYKTFRKIYAWNTGNSPDTYPIKSLAYEINHTESADGISKSKIQAMRDGWKQLLPLLHFPYSGKILLVATIQTLLLMGLNTFRLWLPQLFAAIVNYQTLHKNNVNDGAGLCTMLEILQPNKNNTDNICVVNYDIQSAYTNNIIVAVVGMGCYVAAAPLTYLIGKKLTLVCASIIGGLCAVCMYFAHTEGTAVALSSVSTGLTGVSATTMLSIVVDIFPTTFRTMTVALTLSLGRTGAIIGNLVFPLLLEAGCLPPFIAIGAFIIGGALLALTLPKTDTKELE